ncbi:MAG: 2-isopropylmalate synthase [Candidatus Omnitrophota bacterium]
MPFHRYRPYPAVFLPDRSWPGKTIIKAPAWCSIDLRDGNQALPKPMNVQEKMEMFNLLVAAGFKEIEVAFPSAAQVEFDFVRSLIEGGHIPDDVTIQVLAQAREHLIRRTFEALQGAGRAIVHLYNPVSKIQREVVFRKDKAGITGIAVEAASLMVKLRKRMEGSRIQFEYSPESFPGAELDYAVEICGAVMDVWKPEPEDKMIINLPSTVEMCTPNIYADRIEWFLRRIKNRESIILSVHTHNDRGTAVAAAELAVMAGAQRVEGSLFGNGERTGNMDIVTMALNLFSQGVDPELYFSDINRFREVYSRCTRMDVHARHPYAGDLVYTAFSGSHQDAIHKGMKARGQAKDDRWDVPYLSIDPKDVGRDYESIIRINSQSGKGGVAYVMENDWGFHIPKEMQPDFARVIQEKTESAGRELSSKEIRDCFRKEYLSGKGAYRLKLCAMHNENKPQKETAVRAVVQTKTRDIEIKAKGKGPVDAFVRGLRRNLKFPIDVVLYEEHALSRGADANAVAYIGITGKKSGISFGVGIDADISTASIKAVLSALSHNRERKRGRFYFLTNNI